MQQFQKLFLLIHVSFSVRCAAVISPLMAEAATVAGDAKGSGFSVDFQNFIGG